MDKFIKPKIEPYYESVNSQLYLGDSFELLKRIKSESIDMIFADPPYFLSNNGITCKGGKMVSVNKGEWDEGKNYKEKHSFNRKWIKLCKRVLKPNGTIWISGTLHNIYSIGMALEEEGYKIINNITWKKTNPPPNLACKCFTHSTETVLWAKKDNAKHLFNYHDMKRVNNGKQMKDVWEGSLTKPSEKKEGKHPTQKPEYLLERIILASTLENDVVLDPFCGSGTTGVVAKKFKRQFIGIDNVEEYLNITKNRLEKIND
jgi:site-specific DNA-methyltransferase (adenine-specific)